MKMKIAQRYRPFSHQPGALALIPGSPLHIQAFPTLWRLFDGQTKLLEMPIGCEGPVEGFTLMQDLERGMVKIFGHAKSGYFALRFYHKASTLYVEGPSKDLIQKFPVEKRGAFARPLERLALGLDKSLEFEALSRRGDLREILPVWFHLAQNVPISSTLPEGGNFEWLKRCQNDLAENRSLSLKEGLSNLFSAAFSSLFMPKTDDDHFLGLTSSQASCGSALDLLSRGGALIRSLFFKADEHQWHFLPMLLSGFTCGRMHITQQVGSCAFEWSKDRIRRLAISPKSSQEMLLSFPSEIKTFRLRMNRFEKGRVMRNGSPLFFEKDKIFFLDRFEK